MSSWLLFHFADTFFESYDFATFYSTLFNHYHFNLTVPIFAVDVGRYNNTANIQRDNFQKAKSIWDEAIQVIAAA